MDWRPPGIIIDIQTIWDGEIESDGAWIKRIGDDLDDLAPTAKRPCLAQRASERAASADACFAPRANLTTMPVELLYVIAAQTSLYDYFALARIDRATWSNCKASADWIGSQVARLAGAKTGRQVFGALQEIRTSPAAWQPSLLRSLARDTRTVEVRDHCSLGHAWQATIDEAYRTNSALTEGVQKSEELRDLLITRLYGPATLRCAKTYVYTEMSAISVEHWPAIFEAHRGGFPDAHPALDEFVAKYDCPSHWYSTSLAERIARRLFAASEAGNIGEQLLRRFGLSRDFQRIHLDPMMVDLIASIPTMSYALLVKRCQKWRPDDSGFLEQVAQAFVKEHGALVLADRCQARQGAIAIDDESMRGYRDAYIRSAERDTIAALDGDERHITHFLDLCERISMHNGEDTHDGLMTLVMQAPWQMQPVLLHRMAHRLHRAHYLGRRELIPVIAEFQQHAKVAEMSCIVAGAWQLQARLIAVAIDSNAALFRHDFARTCVEVQDIFNRCGDLLPPKAWGPVLKSVANLPFVVRSSAMGPVNDHLIASVALSSCVNHFLRDPEANLWETDAALFKLIKAQIPKVWEVLPDAAGNPDGRLAALASRLGFSDVQHRSVRLSMLDEQAKCIAQGEHTMPEALTRYGFVAPADQRYIEDRLWENFVRPWLVKCSECPPWVLKVISPSEYLKEKVRIYSEPIF